MKIKELKELITEISNINTAISIDDVMEVASINPQTEAAINQLRNQLGNIIVNVEEEATPVPAVQEEVKAVAGQQLSLYPDLIPEPEIVNVPEKVADKMPEEAVEHIKGKPLKVVAERDWDNLDDVKAFYAESIMELPAEAIKPSEDEFVKFAKIYAKNKRGGQAKLSFMECLSTCKYLVHVMNTKTAGKKLKDTDAAEIIMPYIHTVLGNKNVTTSNVRDIVAGRTYGVITSYYFHRTNRIIYKS